MTGSKVAAFLINHLVSFLLGTLFCGSVLVPAFIAFWLYVMHTALQEADLRAAKQIMVCAGKMGDARKLDWQWRNGVWYCDGRQQ